MSDMIDAKTAQREYMRRWRIEHPENVRAAQRRYWQRKAAKMQLQKDQDHRTTGGKFAHD